VNVFYEFDLRQINKKHEELCGDSVEFSAKPDIATLVFSDGLGSGVKASILSTLTTRIAARMLDEGLPLDDVVQTISETLPICRTRKIAYSTFTMAQLSAEGNGKLVAFDSPPPIVIRRHKARDLHCEECEVAGKQIADYNFDLRPGDWLVQVSDGVLNAGIGGSYPLGWGWDNVVKYLEGHVDESLSAEQLAKKLARVVVELYDGPPGDDVSIAVIKARRKRMLVIFMGPPVNKKDDDRVVETLMSSPGRHVVCGGTTANIVARHLGRGIIVELQTSTNEVPATGRIEGIDLVTEGTLTVTQTLDILRSGKSVEQLKPATDGASALAVILMEADAIKVLVGRAMNPAHQNPSLPRNLAIKPQVVRELAEELKQRGKEVEIEYF